MIKYTSSQLVRFIRGEQIITCSFCGKEDAVSSLDNASFIFFRDGWRATSKNKYCPKCAVKKLKIKSK